LPGIRRAESHTPLRAAPIQEDGHEERFAGEETLARAHQRTHEAALLRGSVAEDGLHLDAIVHVHHAAGLSDGGLVRIQLDFDELHVVAEDLVVESRASLPCRVLSPIL
jgi:hypothetical protein